MRKAIRWVFYSLVGLVVLAVVVPLAILAVVCALNWSKLPDLKPLTDYRPRVPLRVYTADGFLIKEIGGQRCVPVKIENVPASLKQALLAAEDPRFYERGWFGWSRITMQVARNFFLIRDRTVNRHLYEILLAVKIERNLSKDQILEMYINQIFLGQRAYGFEVAAQTYFGKSLGELSLAEAAMLAGLPRGPSSMNPIASQKRAKTRQGYVLGRMRDLGYIDEATYEAAMKEPLQTKSRSAARDPSIISPVHAEYVTEMARQIAEGYDKQATQRGLKVYTTITSAEQEAAYEALRQGVMDYDRRHGYRGPEKYITMPDTKVDTGNFEQFSKTIDEELSNMHEGDEHALPDYGDLLLAVVIDASPDAVMVYRNGELIKIAGKGLSFASPMLKANAPQDRQVRRGALVRIRKGGGNKGWELTQVPEVDATLVSVDSNTGAVRALVGGFDFNRSQFNNVTQLKRCMPDFGCSPWEVATACVASTKGGYQINPFIVREIQDANGNTLARFGQQEAGEIALRAVNTCNTKALDLKRRDGILNRKDIVGRASKNDAWFYGYSPEVVAVAWVGFHVPRNIGETGEKAAFPIWANYMRTTLVNIPDAPSPRTRGGSSRGAN